MDEAPGAKLSMTPSKPASTSVSGASLLSYEGMSAARQFYWIREIAKGGMGQIDLVVRSEGAFRRLYAVKRLRSQFREDESFRSMFTEEARLAGLINHPNVVGVLDVGEDEQGPYLFMDYIDGRSLSEVIKCMRAARAYVPIELALQIMMQVADGLHAAHELRDASGGNLGLVHRDVSPQNVMIGFDGTVRVTDFGIAKALGRSTETTVGVVKGKLGYVSPEQLAFRALDRRSDIFSYGVVFYELLTLKRLYSNKDGRGPERILNEPPPDVGLERNDVPPALVELMFRMLEKDPAQRPSTAGEIAETLREMLAGQFLMGGGVSLPDFMNEHMEDEVTGTRQDISSALKLLDDGLLPVWPKVAPAPEAATKRRPMALNLALAAVLLLAGVGGGLAIAGSGGEERGEEATETTATERPEPAQPVGVMPQVPTEPAPELAPRPPAQEESAASPHAPEKNRRTRRRNRGMGTMAASTTSPMEAAAMEAATMEAATMESATMDEPASRRLGAWQFGGQ